MLYYKSFFNRNVKLVVLYISETAFSSLGWVGTVAPFLRTSTKRSTWSFYRSPEYYIYNTWLRKAVAKMSIAKSCTSRSFAKDVPRGFILHKPAIVSLTHSNHELTVPCGRPNKISRLESLFSPLSRTAHEIHGLGYTRRMFRIL